MAKKTLEEKINCVKWSALLFAIVYFLIGAWLKSDGPLFDPDKAYELIRDSLTLTAYFLAPVAAFVLFSDWREQHVLIKLEKNNEHIYSLSRRIASNLNKINDEVSENNGGWFEKYFIETELYLNEFWDNLFNMGLNQNSNPQFIKQGFKAFNEFDNILKRYREIRGEIAKKESLIDMEKGKDSECDEELCENLFDEELCETLPERIADARMMLNDFIPDALQNQISF